MANSTKRYTIAWKIDDTAAQAALRRGTAALKAADRAALKVAQSIEAALGKAGAGANGAAGAVKARVDGLKRTAAEARKAAAAQIGAANGVAVVERNGAAVRDAAVKRTTAATVDGAARRARAESDAGRQVVAAAIRTEAELARVHRQGADERARIAARSPQTAALARQARADRLAQATAPIEPRPTPLANAAIRAAREQRRLAGEGASWERAPYETAARRQSALDARRARALESGVSYHGVAGMESLPRETKRAVDDYSGVDYRAVNAAARGVSRVKGEQAATIAAQTARIDQAVAAGKLVRDQVLHRGTALHSFGLAAVPKPGDVIRDRAFLSTSTSAHVAEKFPGDVRLQIHASAGTHAADVSHLAGGLEREVLLARNQAMRVKSVHVDPQGRNVVVAEAIHAAEARGTAERLEWAKTLRDRRAREIQSASASTTASAPIDRAAETARRTEARQARGAARAADRARGADPAVFAERVQRAASQVPPEGWFGDQKVFVSHAHAAYQKSHGPISADDFKRRLVAANKARSLELGRMDLVGAMDPATVKSSAIGEHIFPHSMGQFGFVRTDPKANLTDQARADRDARAKQLRAERSARPVAAGIPKSADRLAIEAQRAALSKGQLAEDLTAAREWREAKRTTRDVRRQAVAASAGGVGRPTAPSAVPAPSGDEHVPRVDVGLHKVQVQGIRFQDQREKTAQKAQDSYADYARNQTAAAQKKADAEKLAAAQASRAWKQAYIDQGMEAQKGAVKAAGIADKKAAQLAALEDRYLMQERKRREKFEQARQKIKDKEVADEQKKLDQLAALEDKYLASEISKRTKFEKQKENSALGPYGRLANVRRKALTDEQLMEAAKNKAMDATHNKRINQLLKEQGVGQDNFRQSIAAAFNLESAFTKVAAITAGIGISKTVIDGIANAFFEGKKNAADMARFTLDTIASLRKLASVAGKLSNVEYAKQIADFGVRTGLGIQGSASFQESFLGRANIVKGINLSEKEFDKYMERAGQVTQAKDIPHDLKGDLFGAVVKTENFQANGQGASEAMARATGAIKVLDAGAGKMAQLGPQFNKAIAELTNENALEGVFRNAIETAVAVSVAAEHNPEEAGTLVARTSKGMRDFEDKDKKKFFLKSGITEKDSYLESVEKANKVIEAEIKRTGHSVDTVVKSLGFSEIREVRGMTVNFNKRTTTLAPQLKLARSLMGPNAPAEAQKQLDESRKLDTVQDAEGKARIERAKLLTGTGTAQILAMQRAEEKLISEHMDQNVTPMLQMGIVAVGSLWKQSGRDIMIRHRALEDERKRALESPYTTAREKEAVRNTSAGGGMMGSVGEAVYGDTESVFAMLKKINEANQKRAEDAAKAAKGRPAAAEAPKVGPQAMNEGAAIPGMGLRTALLESVIGTVKPIGPPGVSTDLEPLPDSPRGRGRGRGGNGGWLDGVKEPLTVDQISDCVALLSGILTEMKANRPDRPPSRTPPSLPVGIPSGRPLR